eukprot:scaffold128344_cov17-Tisochrysis_lutea.AAC.2
MRQLGLAGLDDPAQPGTHQGRMGLELGLQEWAEARHCPHADGKVLGRSTAQHGLHGSLAEVEHVGK